MAFDDAEVLIAKSGVDDESGTVPPMPRRQRTTRLPPSAKLMLGLNGKAGSGAVVMGSPPMRVSAASPTTRMAASPAHDSAESVIAMEDALTADIVAQPPAASNSADSMKGPATSPPTSVWLQTAAAPPAEEERSCCWFRTT